MVAPVASARTGRRKASTRVHSAAPPREGAGLPRPMPPRARARADAPSRRTRRPCGRCCAEAPATRTTTTNSSGDAAASPSTLDAIVADAPDEIWSLVSVDPALEPGAVLVAEGTDDAVAFIALTDDTMRRAIALKLPHAPSVRVGDRLVAAADGRVARAPDGAADLLGATVRAEDVLRGTGN